ARSCRLLVPSDLRQLGGRVPQYVGCATAHKSWLLVGLLSTAGTSTAGTLPSPEPDPEELYARPSSGLTLVIADPSYACLSSLWTLLPRPVADFTGKRSQGSRRV